MHVLHGLHMRELIHAHARPSVHALVRVSCCTREIVIHTHYACILCDTRVATRACVAGCI